MFIYINKYVFMCVYIYIYIIKKVIRYRYNNYYKKISMYKEK